MESSRGFERRSEQPHDKSGQAESSRSARSKHASTWRTSLDTRANRQASNNDKSKQIDEITTTHLAQREGSSSQQQQWQFEKIPFLEVPEPSLIMKLKDNWEHFEGEHRHKRVNEQIKCFNQSLQLIEEKLNNGYLPKMLHKQFKKSIDSLLNGFKQFSDVAIGSDQKRYQGKEFREQCEGKMKQFKEYMADINSDLDLWPQVATSYQNLESALKLVSEEHRVLIEVVATWKYAAAIANYENKLFACTYESTYEDGHLDFEDPKINGGRTKQKVYEDSSRNWKHYHEWFTERHSEVKKVYNGGIDSNVTNLTPQFLNKNLENIEHNDRDKAIELYREFKHEFTIYQNNLKKYIYNDQCVKYVNNLYKELFNLLPEKMNKWYNLQNYHEKIFICIGDEYANHELSILLNNYKNIIKTIDNEIDEALNAKSLEKADKCVKQYSETMKTFMSDLKEWCENNPPISIPTQIQRDRQRHAMLK